LKNKTYLYLICLPWVLAFITYGCCKKGDFPTVTTTMVSVITDTTAQGGGTVLSDGGSEVTERGIRWSYSNDFYEELSFYILGGSGTGSFSVTLTDLYSFQKCYVQAYARNENGTGYGETLSFRPPATIAEIKFNPTIDYGTLTDQDGNTYKTVTIGTQTWMAENLKTTRFNEGTYIPLVENGDLWPTLITPAYCWFDNDESYFRESFGALYNWYAVNTGKLCPSGWHVPDNNDWETLITYLGSNEVAGGKLKETGSTHWERPNTGATNESGFTAIPAGKRWGYSGGAFGFGYCRINALWWSQSSLEEFGYTAFLTHYDPGMFLEYWSFRKNLGQSVRCLKD